MAFILLFISIYFRAKASGNTAATASMPCVDQAEQANVQRASKASLEEPPSTADEQMT